MADLPSRLVAALAERYALERELGQGGMATVYLAEDVKHRRKVAVKVLRPELAATLGPERFSREIEVAARLQHPHILPLHDSGEAGGFLYYVMPYVDGHNLRHRLTRQGELPIHDAVRIMSQVADALGYAHGQGVVHRDIKPDNVLISGRHALVTDFGVAKAVSEATGRHQLTTAGIALGTPAYMAPEQAAADPHLDHRVDIYALGALGYELLTGRPLFTGQSSAEVLAAQVTQQPEPITARRPAVPEALDAIVMKCLAKRPADRWQDAGELASQLEQQLTPSVGVTPTQTRPMPSVAVARSAGWRRWLVGAAVVLLAATALAFLLGRGASGTAPTLGKRAAVTLDPGLEINPAVSPDGKLVAYSRMTPAETRLVVQQLAGGEPVTVARWPGLVPAMPAWSADGARLAYTTPRGLEVIPALGGVTRFIAPQTADQRLGWAAWSPRNDEIVYSSADTLYVRDLSADKPRFLLRAENPHSPAWSPDGKWIAYVSGNPQYPTFANLAPSSIWVAPASGGAPVRLTADRPLHSSPVWMPDSRSLLYVSDEDGGNDVYWIGLGRSGAPARSPVRLTTGLRPHTISLSADGRELLYSLHTETSNVYRVALQPGRTVSLRNAEPVTSGSQLIEGFSVSPDGRWLVFDSNRSGNQDVWRMPLDGSALPEPLSTGPEDEFQPHYSFDGAWASFHATRSGSVRDLYVVPAAGGSRVRIQVPTPNNLAPRISPDGRSVMYTVWGETGELTVQASRRAPGDAGWGGMTHSFTLQGNLTGAADWSPDGHWLAWVRDTMLLRSQSDGREPRTIGTIPRDFTLFYLCWPANSREVYYSGTSTDGVYHIYQVPADGGPTREVARSEGPTYQNFRFDFDVHGRTLYFALADRQSDVWRADVLLQ
jgi:Tol biopolymer transport system component/tRNA A-37 threonylcarbamoyl transferase component Bud32